MGIRYSAVGLATRYGLEGPGIESRWGRDFPHPFRSALAPNQTMGTMGTVSFLGVALTTHNHLAPRLNEE